MGERGKKEKDKKKRFEKVYTSIVDVTIGNNLESRIKCDSEREMRRREALKKISIF